MAAVQARASRSGGGGIRSPVTVRRVSMPAWARRSSRSAAFGSCAERRLAVHGNARGLGAGGTAIGGCGGRRCRVAAGEAIQGEVDAPLERGWQVERWTSDGEQRDGAGPVQPDASDEAQRVAGQSAQSPQVVQVGELGVLRWHHAEEVEWPESVTRLKRQTVGGGTEHDAVEEEEVRTGGPLPDRHLESLPDPVAPWAITRLRLRSACCSPS